jgi:ribosomal protein S4
MKKSKKRIDQLLFEKSLAESREKAQRLILAKKVKADGQFILKPGMKVPEDAQIEIEKGPEFVGKGGQKIQSAYKKFFLDFKNKVVADIGPSLDKRIKGLIVIKQVVDYLIHIIDITANLHCFLGKMTELVCKNCFEFIDRNGAY